MAYFRVKSGLTLEPGESYQLSSLFEYDYSEYAPEAAIRLFFDTSLEVTYAGGPYLSSRVMVRFSTTEYYAPGTPTWNDLTITLSETPGEQPISGSFIIWFEPDPLLPYQINLDGYVTTTNAFAPIITTSSLQAVAEGTTFVAELIATDADDPGGVNPSIFTITGGADRALFEIVNGNLVFKAARDYETEAHLYKVEVSADDGVHSTAKTITVNLTDVDDGPPTPPLFTEGADPPRNLSTLIPSDFTVGNATASLGGNDVVTLPGTVAKWADWGVSPGGDGRVHFDAGSGNDTITGGALNDWVDGGAGRDEIKGGGGEDTAIYHGSFNNFEFAMTGAYGDVYVDSFVDSGGVKHENAIASERDHAVSVELFEFDKDHHTFQVTQEWASLVGVNSFTNGHFNQQKLKTKNGFAYDKLKSASTNAQYVKKLLGDPTSKSFKKSLSKKELFYNTQDEKYGLDITGVGYKLAVKSLKDIFHDVSKKIPGLMDHISSAGMLNIRPVDGSKSASLHSWGLAIDLRVDGLLDGPESADGKTYNALAQLIPYFNRAGWFSGAIYDNGKQDAMHFEVSLQRLKQWDHDNLI